MSTHVMMGVSKLKQDTPDWLLERRCKHAGLLVERLLAKRVPFTLTFDIGAEFETDSQHDAVFCAEDEAICEIFRAEDAVKAD